MVDVIESAFEACLKGANSKRMLTFPNFPQSAITTHPASSVTSSEWDEVYAILILSTSDIDEPRSGTADTFRYPFLSA